LSEKAKTPCRKFRWFWTSLARQAACALVLEIGGDHGRVDPVDRRFPEEPLEVSAQVAAIVLDRRALAVHHVLQVIDVERASVGECLTVGGGEHEVVVDPLAKLALGLNPRQTARAAL
jgi:hypothetical protein